MKLVTFTRGEAAEIGVVVNDTTIVPLTSLAPDMITLIADWDNARPQVEALAAARQVSAPFTFAISAAISVSPFTLPQRIFSARNQAS